MLLGHPGSGKTYFTQQLATTIGAVRINADATRVSALGSIEKAMEFEKQTGLLDSIVFKMLDYVTLQILQSGNSVICDYQHNNKAHRSNRAAFAKQHDAIPVIVWVQAPRDIAIQRGTERDECLDQRKHSKEMMEELISRWSTLFEHPDTDENLITIDGTVPFVEQHRSFFEQLQNFSPYKNTSATAGS